MAPEDKMSSNTKYTCNEYREEMILLGLQRRLQQATTEEERQRILQEIATLEKKMGL